MLGPVWGKMPSHPGLHVLPLDDVQTSPATIPCIPYQYWRGRIEAGHWDGNVHTQVWSKRWKSGGVVSRKILVLADTK